MRQTRPFGSQVSFAHFVTVRAKVVCDTSSLLIGIHCAFNPQSTLCHSSRYHTVKPQKQRLGILVFKLCGPIAIKITHYLRMGYCYVSKLKRGEVH